MILCSNSCHNILLVNILNLLFLISAFFDEIESVCRLALSESPEGKATPVVVHCSAGVGRTGVAILTQIMKACLEYNEVGSIEGFIRFTCSEEFFNFNDIVIGFLETIDVAL